MRVKRLLTAAFLSAALAASAIGCGSKTNVTTPSTPAQTQADTPAAPTVKETEAQTEAPEETTAEPTTEAPEETTAEPTTEAPARAIAVGDRWYVDTIQLNIREIPSTEGNIVAELYRDEEVLVMELAGDGWVRIRSASGEGYVNGNFLKPTKSDGTTEPNPENNVSENGAAASGSSSSVPAADNQPAANGHIVCIDAGHQQHGISEQEPNGPGSSVMKAKLTTGTSGIATGLTEYQLNLDVSLMLKAELQARGYSVVMIRESNDCPLSNAERAQVANTSGAEAFVRVHANSSDNQEVRGAMFYAPSPANPYMSQELIAASNALASTMLNSFCATTGIANRGLLQDDTMTGINWCTIPVTIAEMGFMSNPDEDRLMADPAFQAVMARGLADGLDAYFGITR